MSRFWVGGTGSWDQVTTTHWSASDGGSGGASVPTAADNVFFTASSGAGTVTCTASAPCRSLQSTGSTITTFTHNTSVTITIGDATAGAGNIALDLSGFTTYSRGSATSSAFSFVSTSATVQTIKWHGTTGPGNLTFNGVGGSWQFLNGYTNSTSLITLTAGTLDTNNQALTTGAWASSGSGVRTLNFGSSAITNGSTATAWSTATNTNLTINPNTATMSFTNPTTLTAGTSTNFNGMSWTVTTNATTTFTPAGSTYANMTLAGTGKFGIISLNALNYTGTLTIGGASTQGLNRLAMISTSPGTQRIMAGGAVVITGDVDFQDIAFSGSPTWTNTGSAYIGDCGNNDTTVTSHATVAATQTWSGTSGGNWSTNLWTTRVPLPQDNVIISSAFIATQTVTIDMPRAGLSIDCSAATGAAKLTIGAGLNVSIYGSLTLANMTYTISSGSRVLVFAGRNNTYSITTVGSTMDPTNFNATTATYNLQDDLTISSGGTGAFNGNGGTLNTNNHTLNFNWSFTGAVAFTLNQGTSTINVGQTGLSTAASTPWNVLFGMGYSWSAGAKINIIQTITTSRTFAGGGLSYPPLNYTVAGSTGTLLITGNNTFSSLNISDASNGRTTTLPASGVQFVAAAAINGTAAKPMVINSTTPGTKSSFSLPVYTDAYSNNIYIAGTASVSAGYLSLPGTAGNYSITPLAAAFQITGDIDIQAYINPTTWTVASLQEIVAKEGNNTSILSYSFAIQTLNRLTLRLSASGTSVLSSNSVTLPFSDGTGAWVRVTWVQNTTQTIFYYSLDPPSSSNPTWTQLNTGTLSVASIFPGDSPIEIGSRLLGTNSLLSGAVYRVIVLNGVNGTPVLNIDYTNTTKSSFTSRYLQLTDNSVLGGNGLALASKNVSNNSGWDFERPPNSDSGTRSTAGTRTMAGVRTVAATRSVVGS